MAQVIFHGVQVVGVGVHEEEGKEKDEEGRVEVKGEVEEVREGKRSSWMACRWSDGLKDDLSQCGVTRDQDEKHERHLTACRCAHSSMSRTLYFVFLCFLV